MPAPFVPEEQIVAGNVIAYGATSGEIFLRGQVGGWVSPRYLPDHLLIAGWAGEDAEVVRLYEGYGAQVALPADVLTGVARAYRNLRLWQPALAVYERGLTRFPDHPPMALGQVLVMADAGQTQQAVRRGLRLVQQAPQDAERRLALGYAHLRDGQRYSLGRRTQRQLVARARSRRVVRHLHVQRAAGAGFDLLPPPRRVSSPVGRPAPVGAGP